MDAHVRSGHFLIMCGQMLLRNPCCSFIALSWDSKMGTLRENTKNEYEKKHLSAYGKKLRKQ